MLFPKKNVSLLSLINLYVNNVNSKIVNKMKHRRITLASLLVFDCHMWSVGIVQEVFKNLGLLLKPNKGTYTHSRSSIGCLNVSKIHNAN